MGKKLAGLLLCLLVFSSLPANAGTLGMGDNFPYELSASGNIQGIGSDSPFAAFLNNGDTFGFSGTLHSNGMLEITALQILHYPGSDCSGSVIALPAFEIDLSSVVSAYIGETVLHLDQILAAAEAAAGPLLADEAGDLFGVPGSSVNGWQLTFNADRIQSAQIPEPAMCFLLLSGLAGIVIIRKLLPREMTAPMKKQAR